MEDEVGDILMKVQIIGGGAVGLLIASFLAEASNEVIVVVRNAQQLEALRQKGITRITFDETNRHVQIQAVTKLRTDVDMTIVTTKSYQLHDVFVQLRKLPNDMPLLFTQNGLAHYEPAIDLPQKHIAFASVQFGAKREENTVVSHKGIGVCKIALAKGAQHKFSSLLRASTDDFPLELTESPYDMLFEKAMLNCFINPLTAILQVRNGRLVENDSAYALLQQLYVELMDAFPAFAPSFPFQSVVTLCNNTSRNTSSMLADRLNGQKSEIDAIVLPVLQKAEQANKTLPTLRTLYQLVVALEKERETI